MGGRQQHILVVDLSGRGHATADLFVRTNPDVVVHYAPGCAGIEEQRIHSHQELTLADPKPMVQYARDNAIDLVYVSNPIAVADGFVDAFHAAGMRVVGPNRLAARLESSKVEAKKRFERYRIPSPEHVSFDNVDAARAYVKRCAFQVVVKADGMCGGNGAFVCDGPDDALEAIETLMVRRVFGAAGDRITIERRYYGREVSFFALVDGESYLTLPMAADYPKSDDGNLGVDCAGMGALSPHPLATRDLVSSLERNLLQPVMRCIAEERLAYTGVIYLGCMVADGEPLLLEINARMGDPEAEVVFPQIQSDFAALSTAMVDGTLARHRLTLNDRSYCTISVTQGPTGSGLPGWPYGEHDTGHVVTGLDRVDREACRVFIGQAIAKPGVGLTTAGGRVAQVCGIGRTIAEASARAYANVGHLHFEGIRYRRDIGAVMPWDTTVAACVERS
jgi:phosphoribosylamine--glycine ligase